MHKLLKGWLAVVTSCHGVQVASSQGTWAFPRCCPSTVQPTLQAVQSTLASIIKLGHQLPLTWEEVAQPNTHTKIFGNIDIQTAKQYWKR